MQYRERTVFDQQLNQLSALNQRMQQQQAEEERQRYLSDVLLAATQAAERVSRTQRQDPFAAAVLGARWLQTLSWVNAGLFSDFHRKQTWEQCRLTFTRACDAVSASGDAGWLTAYLQVEDREIFLFGVLGSNGEGLVASGLQAMQKAQRTRKNRWIAIGILFLLWLIVSLLVWAVDGPGGVIAGGFFLVFLVSIVLLSTIPDVPKAERDYHYLAVCFDEWRALQTSDPGFPLLGRLRREHPLILAAPIDEGPATYSQARALQQEGGTVQRETVERQTIVGRCRFCSQLTPVDLARCRSCGAERPI